MIASITGQFLGIQEIAIKDKPSMRVVQLLQCSKSGKWDIATIPITNGFTPPKPNEKITLDVTVSAFLGKKDGQAKIGLRMD